MWVPLRLDCRGAAGRLRSVVGRLPGFAAAALAAGLAACGAGGGATSGAGCLGSDLLATLGKDHLLVGYADDVAHAPFDLRYQYLAGPIADATQPCADDQWWGCWQDLSRPPGEFVTSFVADASGRGQIPMFTYYLILPASGAAEGAGEVAAANDLAFMRRYLADWRFLLGRIGTATAFLHVEPDFWGYAEHVGADPRAIPARVASASPDCAGEEESVAGLGRCMIHMARRYAPKARIGLHASGWGTRIDVLMNRSASLDVAAEGRKLGAFLLACGAGEGDFVVADMSDRDAGYYQSLGMNTWWSAGEALPSFHQAFAWAAAVAEAVGRPVLWWQIPVGNSTQANASGHWKDNRVEYLFDHPDEVARAHGIGMAFGAGAGGQTTPSTDGGLLDSRASLQAARGGTPICR